MAGVACAVAAAPAGAVVSSVPEASPVQFGGGTVNAIVRSADHIYVGGGFTRAGRPAPFGADVSSDGEASVNSAFAAPNGEVRVAVADGAGGWYLGGAFTSVGGIARNRVAHLLANGSVDPAFDPNVDGPVSALVRSGSTIYIGGDFTTAGGQARADVAAVSATTGVQTSFDGGLETTTNKSVTALALSGSRVYVAGTATKIVGATTYTGVFALDAATGAVIATFASPTSDNPTVNTVAAAGGKVYFGGNFTTVNGQERFNLAALNESDGSLDAVFHPATGDTVSVLRVAGDKVYAGGTFTQVSDAVGSLVRNRIVRFNLTDGLIDRTWLPNVPGAGGTSVNALDVSGSTVFVSGQFVNVRSSGSTINIPRNNAAAFDIATGAATAFNPNANTTVGTIAAQGSRVYIGGLFGFAGTNTVRSGIAALNLDGTLDAAFNPNVTNVNALALSGSKLYAGGTFTTANGTARSRLAAFNAATGALDATFNPNMGGSVFALLLAGGKLYVGGGFTAVNGVAGHTRLVALDATSGIADPAFNQNLDSTVNVLALTGNTLYAGGALAFANCSADGSCDAGLARNGLAAFDATTGVVDATFDPNMGSSVNALLVSGGKLYAGGIFTTVNGTTPRNRLAALDPATGAVDPAFDANMGGTVSALALSGGKLYAGGAFTTVNGSVTRNRLAALDPATGAVDPAFNPNLGNTVATLTATGSNLYAGGLFGSVGGQPQLGFAEFDEPAAPVAVSGAASAITDTGATLSGTVDRDGQQATYAFEYGTSLSFGALTPPDDVSLAPSPAAVSAALTGLTANTRYYYRLVATSAVGTSLGAVRSFRTTGPPQAPTVVTGAAGSVTNTTASVAGQVNPNGGQTAFTVEYGTTTSFGAISPIAALDDADGLEAVTTSLTGLQADTTYYYRFVATNAAGTTIGAVAMFNTGPGGAPIVTTGTPATVSATTAVLTATVDAHGAPTAFTFEYGPTTAFGSLTAVDSASATNGTQAVSLTATGLAPGTTYRYRIVATNGSGTTMGTVRSFTTAAAAT